jgi:TrmH family RNA methyltransferase
LERNAPLDTIVYAPDLLTSDAGRAAVAGQQAQGARVVAVSAEVFASFSERDNPVGLGAIANVHLHELAALPEAPDAIFVALDAVSDPGNLGTIVRTMDGMGATGLILVGHTTDPFHPTAVKASMGALFSVPVAEAATLNVLWGWAAQRGLHTIATSARAPLSFWEAPYRFPALLLLGSEGEGLAAGVLQRAELAVTIPMRGVSSSLNLAVAAGLLLYELRRRLA